MKTFCILALFTLSVMVKGAWWAAATQPIILSFGALLTALNLDVQPLLDVDWKNVNLFESRDRRNEKPFNPIERLKKEWLE